MEEWEYGWIDVWMDGGTDRQTDKWVNRNCLFKICTCENSEPSKFLTSLGYILVADGDSKVIFCHIVIGSMNELGWRWWRIINLIRVSRNCPFKDYSWAKT